jgi:DNA-binding NtrC family response regulator
VPVLTPETRELLLRYSWPGNVRELKNLAERLVARFRDRDVTIDDLPSEFRPEARAISEASRPASPSRADMMFERIIEDRACFWTLVHTPFMQRDITRDDLRALLRMGLTATRGSYKALLQLFNMPPEDYKRFLNFLRKHHLHLPIHEFRRLPFRPAVVSARKTDLPDVGTERREVLTA